MRELRLTPLAFLVVILAGAVWAAWSNPTTDDYVRFVESELHRALDLLDERTSARDQRLIHEVIRAQSKQLMDGVVRPATIRKNWGFFSSYETRVAGAKVVVLGIGGRFVPISGTEEAAKTIERLLEERS
ncbi:MAG: DUF4359 domain-containing protein [Nitrospira sp.]|nr:DUF4359 domain-containing protein [Nitrospira sp.]MCP9461906.1 DUF4359 domain-containing protein [Nitrospira sp.]MCP9474994.1 DUF4359 domain-containing protein [Nitrospira sp.]